ncbi:MAG TPA: ACT domain-containing protein [Kiritimatiellia bacterium]|nr:ACT domain-containing protein [Kiritimatiellia bacterium]
MKINQISLFLENKPGHLNAVCRTLAEAQINIVTLSLADTQQFGIVRLIVEEWQKAKTVLEQAGYVVNVREVVAATVPDRPGGMAEVLDAISQAGVNIEYMYAFAFHHGTEAVLVFRFDNPDRAIEALKAAGRNVLDAVTLFTEAK